jgi:hypothetical protein
MAVAEGIGDARFHLLVQLAGMMGPRCEGSDPACGPTVYTREELADADYECDGARTPAADAFGDEYARLSGGACAHDGECVQGGCGNRCIAWPEAGGAGTCEGYPELEDAPAFCGCVSGQCTWFVQ